MKHIGLRIFWKKRDSISGKFSRSGRPGFGDSPYQSFSAFAGQPLLISPKHLQELGLLTEEDLADCPCTDEEKVNYGDVILWKTDILHKAYENYCHTADKMLLEEYDSFYENNRFWLDDYALFMACKEVHNGQSWLDWEKDYRSPSKAFLKNLEISLAKEIRYHHFVQFIFFKEWYALKEYANKKDIKIIGDIPIFVSLDSADVWANQELFQLDSKGFPTSVAGFRPIISRKQGNFGETRSMIGTNTRKTVFNGGFPAFKTNSDLQIICESTISADLKHIGQFLTGKKPQ